MRWFGRRDSEYREELEAHIQMEIQANLERGMSAADARNAALRTFGNALAVRERLSDERPVHVWETFGRDIQYGLRLWRRSPSVTATTVLTLALVIGANAVVFSVVRAALLRQLPFPAPDRLVLLWGTSAAFGQRSQISITDLSDWRHESNSFVDIAAFQSWWNPTLNWDNRPAHEAALQVSDGYFRVMQANPLFGRLFVASDQVPGNDHVVILTYSLWRDRFQADPTILGKAISLDSVPYLVVGVLPADSHSLPASLLSRPPLLYTPLAEPYDNNRRGWTHLRAIARLRPGVTAGQAQAELSIIADRQARAYPASNAGRGVHVVALQDDVLRDLRPALLILQGAVLCVLLIACANLANLSLARAGARRKEIALRSALGAGRWRLLSQLLTETMLTNLLGGACGLLLAAWGVSLLRQSNITMLLDFPSIAMDWSVIGAVAAVAALSGLAVALVPALLLTRTRAGESMHSGGRSAGTAGRTSTRRLLTVAEVAVSAVLLILGGLLLRSFVSVLGVNPGFDAHGVFTAQVDLPDSRYTRIRDQASFYARVLANLQALPGVESAAAVSILPESGKADHTVVRIAGRTDPPGQELLPDVYRITPDYFRTLRIPLLEGRTFTVQDDRTHEPVAIVNRLLAATLWPSQSAIGQKMFSGSGNTWRTVVGVVDDVYQYGRDGSRTMQFYVPQAENGGGYMTLLVRSERSPADLTQALRAAVSKSDPELAIYNAATMESIVSGTMSARRFTMLVVLSFAAAAVLLAAIGLYGVVAYGVAERTREFGIRTALGAKRAEVLRLVLGDGTRMVVAGLILGLIAARAATRYVSALLFGVTPADSVTFVAVPLILLAVALAASYLPARRATRVDPSVALRYE